MIRHCNRHIVRPLLTAVLVTVTFFSNGQVLTPDQPQNRNLILAEEQFRQQHYALAALSARQFVADKRNETMVTDLERAQYISVISGIMTDEPQCVENATAMMAATKNKAYAHRIAYYLGHYYFIDDDFNNAIAFYEQAGLGNLTNQEIADEKFELAYCYFNNKQFDKAAPLFAYIKALKDDKYYKAANYYYGLLCYNEDKLQEALESFEKIRDDKEYSAYVPYYIAEINYFLGNRSVALRESKEILSGREKSYYDNDVHLLAAQCLFEDKDFAGAMPYFEFYYDHSEKIRKEDLYKIGYCYYKVNESAKAIDAFKVLSGEKDSLGQTAMYLLGDCYLKNNDRPSARNAFGTCADLTFNKAQQEASMILYSRISYEEGFYDDALDQLKVLIETFPGGQYTDEANTLISDLLLKTNNFEKSLEYLKEVRKKEKNYWKVYQKASYGFAVQQFNGGKLQEAYGNFEASVQHHNTDQNLESAAYFWMAEISYRQHNYTAAISNAQEFIDRKIDKAGLAKISPQATSQHAYLIMGFAAMESQQFAEAQSYFNKAGQTFGDDASTPFIAALHEADAVFMQQNYLKAITLYDKIAKTDTENADYANYQKSVIYGLQGKNMEKIVVLQKIVAKNPPSSYAPSAHYELALTYIETNKYPLALTHLNFIVDSTGDKTLAPKAWLKVGFVNQQTNKVPEAIEAYKNVVVQYPASDERMAALDALKSLYIQNNEPSAYAKLLKENNLPSAESNSIDSTYYAAAENQFAAGKWETAKKSFTDYLGEFPNGIFAIKAHYYRGECNFQLKSYKDAMKDYDSVLATKWNDFSENSARHAATIAYDDSNYTAALKYYHVLRDHATSGTPTEQTAFQGIVKSAYNAEKYPETAVYADSLLALPGNPAEAINEALLFKARALQKTGKTDTAFALYKQLVENKNGAIAAECRYHVAEILVGRDSLKDGEDAANETIKLSAGYEYWIVKSYILLGDIFIKEKDYFNAKATLTSIVKHAKLPALKAEATQKLEVVKELEKKHSKLKKE